MQSIKKTFTLLLAFAGLLASCTNDRITVDGVSFAKSTKINEIQVLGTHNSYAKPIDTAILSYMDPIMAKMMTQYIANMTDTQRARYFEYHPNRVPMSEGLAYDHPDFPTQLNAGLRSLELDVWYDSTGNRFNRPAAYTYFRQKGQNDLLPHDTTDLDQPGFKVLHIADVDFRTHYTTFERALQALKAWSDAHPKHTPIYIMIEAKGRSLPIFPNPTPVLPYTVKAFDELDQAVFDVLGREKIITPDDVRGDFNTLEAAILAKNWPTLEASLGKFVFMLLPTTGGLGKDNLYVKDRPSLEGRAMFVRSEMGQPYAAFLLLDNSIIRKEDIQSAVRKGYLVRTRADIETYEAKTDDLTRANAAFESGAQVISTDFFRAGNVYGTNYVVEMPNGQPVRANPVNGGE